jgi:hypothetical protein
MSRFDKNGFISYNDYPRNRAASLGHSSAGGPAFPFGEHDDLLAAATGTAYLLDRPEPRVW